MNVLKLEKSATNPKVIECLERCLQEAKEGKIVNCIIVMEGHTDYSYAISGFDDRLKLLGFLSYTTHKIHTS